jgi:hypothetical protein
VTEAAEAVVANAAVCDGFDGGEKHEKSELEITWCEK